MTINQSDASKWEVVHDPLDQLYFVVNRNGTRLPSKYTTRTIAEKGLEAYLSTPKLKPKKVNLKPTPIAKPISEVLEQLEI